MNLMILPDKQDLKLYRYFDGNKWYETWERSEDGTRTVMDNHLEEMASVRQQVVDGKLSPLGYHIEDRFFTVDILSSYTGIPKRHIKKHIKPEKFNKLEYETLKKYADVFGISVEELKKV